MRGIGGYPKKRPPRKTVQKTKRRTNRSIRVLITKTASGFETTMSTPRDPDLSPLVTTDSAGLWNKIRNWLESHWHPHGWTIDWIYADFHPENAFPHCPPCSGTGHRPGAKLGEPGICVVCHGIKVALPGFND